jgi:hypothetical protein
MKSPMEYFGNVQPCCIQNCRQSHFGDAGFIGSEASTVPLLRSELPVSSRRYLRKKPCNGAAGISFKRVASQIFPQLALRPQTLSRRTEQAGMADVLKTAIFWGCPGLNFTANLPFIEMREVFATLLKEIPAPCYLKQFFSIR